MNFMYMEPSQHALVMQLYIGTIPEINCGQVVRLDGTIDVDLRRIAGEWLEYLQLRQLV